MSHVCTGFFFVIIGLQRFFWGVLSEICISFLTYRYVFCINFDTFRYQFSFLPARRGDVYGGSWRTVLCTF